MALVLFCLAVFCTPIGLVLIAVGVILRLCESRWGKSAGEMGSRSLLLIGVLLCLPVVIFLSGAV